MPKISFFSLFSDVHSHLLAFRDKLPHALPQTFSPFPPFRLQVLFLPQYFALSQIRGHPNFWDKEGKYLNAWHLLRL